MKATAVLTWLAGSAGPADASALYDMSVFLNQQHPFDTQQAEPVTSLTEPTASPVTTRPVATNARTATSGGTGQQPVPQLTQAGGASRFGERSDSNNGWGAISEIRVGVLNHDEGPFSRNKEEDNPDINAEVLFVSPDILDLIWSPRPHVGAAPASCSCAPSTRPTPSPWDGPARSAR